tara:strand:- start:40017 stop:41168 length:1152 start_codon:yes stop_codon:yes gene_type:complete
MRDLTKLSVLFILFFTQNSFGHRGENDGHERLSDPVRIDQALEELELNNRVKENTLCEDVANCLLEKQAAMTELATQMSVVTEYISRLMEDEELKQNQDRLKELLQQCRDISTEDQVAELVAKIDNTHWIHGSEDCNVNADPEIQVERIGMGLSIMRQNKCLTAEAPFLYILESEDKVVLIDTGDIYEGSELYNQVQAIAGDREIVVTHTHAHGDHTGGDNSFSKKENCQLHSTGIENNKEMFGIENWPDDIGTFDMGDRELQIIPVPGHERSSIAIYDPQSKVMLTGDIMYPGRLYINNYPDFLSSLDRLKEFSEENEVSAYLGGHVEMSNEPGEDIGFGNYAPNERSLVLRNSDLDQLYDAAYKNSDSRDNVTLDQFIIYP